MKVFLEFHGTGGLLDSRDVTDYDEAERLAAAIDFLQDMHSLHPGDKLLIVEKEA